MEYLEKIREKNLKLLDAEKKQKQKKNKVRPGESQNTMLWS